MAPRLFNIFKRREPELDCEHVHDMSSDFIDDDLTEEAKQNLASHLEWCPPCNAFINTLRATVGRLRSTPKEVPPDDFKERVRESIRRARAE